MNINYLTAKLSLYKIFGKDPPTFFMVFKEQYFVKQRAYSFTLSMNFLARISD